MKKNIYAIIVSTFLLILLTGCEKFLEEKSDKSLSVPNTIEDFQAMLNTVGNLNTNYVAAGEMSSDDYYLSDADIDALYYENDKRLYTWQPDYVARPQSSAGDEWYNLYMSVYICNSVLKGLEESNLRGTEADIIKGQALTFRAARYLDGVQIWSPVYSKLTADSDLGMVLRSDPDMNIPSIRSSVKQTYDFIINDLNHAIALLPKNPLSVTLPGKAAAYGLLARAYLYMGEYENALLNAESALENTNAHVIDFNTLDVNSDFPIPAANEVSAETIFWSVMFYADPLSQEVSKISPMLYDMYQDGDLRKQIYFGKNPDDSYFFKGTHLGYFGLMNSLTTSEMLLILAECNARKGKISESTNILNQLLIKRWNTDRFIPYSFTSAESALQIILDERRKELVMRGLRWPDLKRLNRDGYNITLTRTVNGQNITLAPNDLRYAIAIPEDVIQTSGIRQNPR